MQPPIPPRPDTPPATSPRLRTIYALMALAFIMVPLLAYRASHDFGRPVPAWMTSAERWYDHVLHALVWWAVAAACVSYTAYRSRLARASIEPRPRPWAARREVRAVLYVAAAVQLLQLPLGVYKTTLAVGPGFPPLDRLLAAFPPGGLIFPVVGIVAIAYDRRRLARERRISMNVCLACGYDLRATPGRCPECGTPNPRPPPPPGALATPHSPPIIDRRLTCLPCDMDESRLHEAACRAKRRTFPRDLRAVAWFPNRELSH